MGRGEGVGEGGGGEKNEHFIQNVDSYKLKQIFTEIAKYFNTWQFT